MAKTTVEVPDRKMVELEAYKDRLGELLLLGLTQVKIQEALLLYQRGLVSIGRAAFPDLTLEDIRACLAFAADRERKLMAIP